ncbi:hypothetical protein [Botrimarina sp.]|uniref:hypothetical protein n=1 Tax=Botrimarina sp. TaxID=2795802 RepID=UPI0032F07CD1
MPKRLGLGSLLLLAPLLALVAALVTWVRVLRQEVTHLERRVATLEAAQPLTVSLDVSNVGVPGDVDRAMLLDAATGPVPIR